jgi:heme exporter protein D
MAEFFAMGGYAPYIWSAYALALVVLVGMVVLTIARHRRTRRTLARLEALRRPERTRGSGR